MTRDQINKSLPRKDELSDLRSYLKLARTGKYLCMCLTNHGVYWCDDSPERRECIWKHREVTGAMNKWLDGEITRREFVRYLQGFEEV